MTEITRFHVAGSANDAVAGIAAWRMAPDWPLLLACRRPVAPGAVEEPPGRHWPDRREVLGLRDGAGSRLAANDDGVVALLLGDPRDPAPGRRDRDELTLEAVDHADAMAAAEALSDLDGRAYDPFVLLVADNRDAYIFRHEGGRDRSAVRVRPLTPGLHALALGPALPAVPPATPPPVPGSGDLDAWGPAMAAWYDVLTSPGPGPSPTAASATSLIALPAAGRAGPRSIWLLSQGVAGFGQFRRVERD